METGFFKPLSRQMCAISRTLSVNKAVRRTYHIFLPIQVPPRSGSLCDFTENSLHRQMKTSNRLESSPTCVYINVSVEKQNMR